MLKVIYVARINKSAEVLAVVGRRSVMSRSDITSSRDLLNLFTGANHTPKRRLIDTLALLVKQGFLSVGRVDDELVYKLTSRGQQHLQHYQNTRFAIAPQTPWPGQWYLVSFEIPESHKAVRNNLILQLKKLGFINYMKGLWLYPYDPAAFITALKKRYKLTDKQLTVMTVTAFPGEKQLRKKFKLE